MRLVMIDNYDSFTYNLVQLFYEFDLEVLVFRHDEIDLAGIAALSPTGSASRRAPRPRIRRASAKWSSPISIARSPSWGCAWDTRP